MGAGQPLGPRRRSRWRTGSTPPTPRWRSSSRTSSSRLRCAGCTPPCRWPASIRRRHELVVADDGSRRPPPPPPPCFPRATYASSGRTTVGCRPGAARNLGAGGDERRGPRLPRCRHGARPPARSHRLAAWPDVLPDALVVGRRRHADLAGWSPADVVAWLGERGPAPPRRADPAWLEDGYRQHQRPARRRRSQLPVRHLRRSWRCGRSLFDDIGGFDDDAVRVRRRRLGVRLPGLQQRRRARPRPRRASRGTTSRTGRSATVGDRPDGETLWLAAHIPEPAARSAAVAYELADTVAVVELADADVGSLVATIASVIEGFGDVAVHVVSAAPTAVVEHFAFDRRVRFAAPAPAQLQRCRAWSPSGDRWPTPPTASEACWRGCVPAVSGPCG